MGEQGGGEGGERNEGKGGWGVWVEEEGIQGEDRRWQFRTRMSWHLVRWVGTYNYSVVTCAPGTSGPDKQLCKSVYIRI